MAVAQEILTERQKDYAILVLQGKTNAEIAKDLDVTEATVRNELNQVYRRLGVRNRVEFVMTVMKISQDVMRATTERKFCKKCNKETVHKNLLNGHARCLACNTILV